MNVNSEEGWSLTGGGVANRSRVGWYIAVGLFIAWNILLFILAVVAIAKANEHHEGSHAKTSYTYQPITRTFTVSAGHSIGPNTFVSLNSDGTVRDGAGTSCYLNSGPELLIGAGATDLQIISFDPDTGITSLSPNEYVVAAYTLNGVAEVRVGLISLDTNTLSAWGLPVTVTGLEKAEAIVPLTTAPGTPKTFAVAGKGHVFIGEISASTHTASFSKGADYITLDTVDTKAQMTRLTPNTFALSYYLIAKSGGAHVMNVTVANVTFNKEGKYESMTYTPAHTYESDRAYSTVFRLADNTFALAYPSVADPELNVTSAVNDSLMVRRVIVSGNTLTLGPEASLSGVKPNYYMSSIGLPHNTNAPGEKGVVVFVDEANNNALTAVVVSPVNNGGSLTPLNSLKFGDIKAFASDVAGSDVWQRHNNKIVPFIDIAHIVDQEIAVVYSDYSNNGRISTFRFSINRDTHAIETIASPFVISSENPNESLDYWWVAVASLGVHHKKGWIALQYLQVPGTTGAHFVNQTIVDIAPPPFGVTTPKTKTTNGGKEIDVVISGAVKFDKKENLTPGRYYYVNTRGKLQERQGTYASTDYVKINDHEFLSLRSRAGVAVAKDELLLINELSEQADY